DGKSHFAGAFEIATSERDLDRFAALPAERENRFKIGKRAGVDAIFMRAAALETKIANLQEIIAISRNGEEDEGIEAVYVFTANQLFAGGVEDGQRGVERRAATKRIDIKHEFLIFVGLEFEVVDLSGG